jgi:riboflavin synthase
MFTGIVEELGHFVSASRTGATTRLVLAASLVTTDMATGGSVAVNGCCLTVVEHGATSFGVDAVDETLSRTNLGRLQDGEAVNLERPVALGGRLGGHLVQGHVDGVGTIVEPAPHMCIEVPAGLEAYLVEKGSVTVDGCSLTVVAVGPGLVHIEVIPRTVEVTTLGRKARGDLVNLEADVVAKYIERLVRAGVASPYGAPATGRP